MYYLSRVNIATVRDQYYYFSIYYIVLKNGQNLPLYIEPQ